MEKNVKEVIKKIYIEAKKNKCNIIIPEDVCVSNSFDGGGINKKTDSVNESEMILDIGQNTIEKIKDIIENSNTVLWNGPAGYFENINFSKGTLAIAEKISDNTDKKSMVSVLGGGDTISAINLSNQKLTFSHLSTAGGAFLEFLEGKDLPGLDVLK